MTSFRNRIVTGSVLLSLLSVLSSTMAQEGAAETGARLGVSVRDVRNDTGHLRLGVFDRDDGFPRSREGAILWRSIPAATESPTFELTLPPGKYAIVILHDENGNKRHDRNWLGVPVEGYGVSNNPKPKLRAATYEEAVFTLPEEGRDVEVSIQYW